tara:strand:+ start:302 stop:658 length:357 start_codon:yes stop_codon:yes gene_type:complete
MTEVTRVGLSGSTDGALINVAATATVGTLIHTATTQTSNSRFDEVWLFASNSHSGAVNLTIEIDIANSATSKFIVSVPTNDGLYVVLPGISVHNAKRITAFAATGDVINICGYVEAHV